MHFTCKRSQFFFSYFFVQLFHDNDGLFIQRRYKICCIGKHHLQGTDRIILVFVLQFNEESDTSCFQLHMQLFRTFKNIHQHQVIQQKGFDEIVFIKLLPVCRDHSFDLILCHTADQFGAGRTPPDCQNILQLGIILDLEQLEIRDLFILPGRRRKVRDLLTIDLFVPECPYCHLPIRFKDSQILVNDGFDLVHRLLQQLIGNHFNPRLCRFCGDSVKPHDVVFFVLLTFCTRIENNFCLLLLNNNTLFTK